MECLLWEACVLSTLHCDLPCLEAGLHIKALQTPGSFARLLK